MDPLRERLHREADMLRTIAQQIARTQFTSAEVFSVIEELRVLAFRLDALSNDARVTAIDRAIH